MSINTPPIGQRRGVLGLPRNVSTVNRTSYRHRISTVFRLILIQRTSRINWWHSCSDRTSSSNCYCIFEGNSCYSEKWNCPWRWQNIGSDLVVLLRERERRRSSSPRKWYDRVLVRESIRSFFRIHVRCRDRVIRVGLKLDRLVFIRVARSRDCNRRTLRFRV